MKETERRKRFFKTALQLIHEKGYKAMTMRDLAKKLDCDVSNIYNYVQSKHALLEQLLFEISNQFHDGMTSIVSSPIPPLEQLKAVIALHIRLTIENPYQVGLLSNEWRQLNPKPQQDFIDFRNTYEQKLQSILQEGVQAGTLKVDNLEFTTNCILSSIRWIYAWYQPENPAIKPAELERLMIDFVLKGVVNIAAIKKNSKKRRRYFIEN